jgi:hypothetical protein
MKIDSDLIEQALHNVAVQKLQKEIRNFIVFQAPDEIRELYAEYVRLVEEKEKNEIPD